MTECGTWTLDQVSPIAYRDPRDYEEHLRQVVTEAVTAALPPAGPVWCELSGGLDSSTVFGLAALARAPGLGALSFVYPESPGADERDWIRLVLDRHPAPWHAIDADAARPFTEAPAGRPREPTFSLLESGWNRCYTSTLRSHGVAAVLTGMGGDEVFGSHTPKPFYLSDLLLQEQMDDLATELEGWVAQDEAHGSAASWLARFAVAPAVAHASGEVLDYRPVRIPWASDAFAHRTGLSERGRRSAVPPTETVGHSWFLAGVLASAHAVSIGLVDREEAPPPPAAPAARRVHGGCPVDDEPPSRPLPSAPAQGAPGHPPGRPPGAAGQARLERGLPVRPGVELLLAGPPHRSVAAGRTGLRRCSPVARGGS